MKKIRVAKAEDIRMINIDILNVCAHMCVSMHLSQMTMPGIICSSPATLKVFLLEFLQSGFIVRRGVWMSSWAVKIYHGSVQ